MSRNHNPLNLSEAQVFDMLQISLKWFEKVNSIDSNAKYPELIWDAMPKSGASQVHTHLQVSMGIGSYYGAMRRVLDASNNYFIMNQRNYFDDFILIHKALGLTSKFNQTYVILNMVRFYNFSNYFSFFLIHFFR
jgi:galactose-1-phosphate uridylyltransferase